MALSERLDQTLVRRGIFESRAKAHEAIVAGLVTINGVVAKKPAMGCSKSDHLEARRLYPWVSRGGVKLDFALDYFGFAPEGWFCLDLGASTGGFSHCLLTRQAGHVLAVDVGRDQFHEKLRSDSRITLLEGQDARTLLSVHYTKQPVFIVCDVSFISLYSVFTKTVNIPFRKSACIYLM